MSQRDRDDRLAARMREIMDKVVDDLRKEITADDLPEVIAYRPPLSPEEIELGARWGTMALGDPLAIIPEARDLALGAVRPEVDAQAAFLIVVADAAEACAAKKIEPRNSAACAKKIKKHVDAERADRELPPVGIGRLKRALGQLAAERKNNSGSGL